MNHKIRNKIKEILIPLQIAENLARKKFFVEILLGIIESRKVQFNEISFHIESNAKLESTESRVQAFFRDFEFNYDEIARLILCLLPRGKLILCMDRTEWDFGVFQCNILMITAKYQGLGIPLYWELLDNKSGNSRASDRIDLFDKCLKLLGKDRIAMWIGDREFIGHKWLKYLKENGISFCVRVPKHHLIQIKNGEILSVEEILKISESKYYQDALVDGIRCNVFIKKLDKEDPLFLIGSEYAKNLGAIYRHRWSIEVCFQSLKGRGFNLRDTHLYKAEKIKKLLVFLSIALIFCMKLGVFLHHKKEKIKKGKGGYKVKSFFRSGLDSLRKCLKNKEKELDFFLLKALALVEFFLLKNVQISDKQRIIKKIR